MSDEITGTWRPGAGRAAEALLQANGMTVRLRVPALASGGDDSEQLGVATPGFEDLELGHGVFRKANSTRVLLLAASAVRRALHSPEVASAEALFAGAAGMVIGNVLYRIEACEAMRAGGGVYAYALTLAAPAQ